MKKAVILILVLLALGAGGYYYLNPLAFVDTPVDSISDDIHQTTLDNGLTITVKEMHTLPLVTIQFWVHVGSKNEPEQYRGIAHIFEHIWFKGTKTQPVGSFHRRVERLGGELNAMTSFDWTMYFVTVPSDKFTDIFPSMVDLFKNPLFDPNEIEKEKQVVVEEQRFSYNEPMKYVDDEWASLLIDDHPYEHPIIGYKDTILAPTREDIMSFYNTWYVPNNMNIVVIGDVDTQTIINEVTGAFGTLEEKPLPQLNIPPPTPVTQPRYNSSTRHLGFTYIAAGFITPAADNPDRYAMDVLTTILSGGDAARIERILKQEKNLIAKSLAGYTKLEHMGAFEIIMLTDPDKATRAKQELILQFNKLRNEPVSQEELERAKALIKADRVSSQEEIFEVGFDIGKHWIMGTLDERPDYIANINDVTAEDVRRVANKYFTAYTMYELKPKL